MTLTKIDSKNRIKVGFNREVRCFDILDGEIIENDYYSHNITDLVHRYEADKYFIVKFRESKYGPDLPEDEAFFDWYVELNDYKSFFIIVEFYFPELVS